MSIPARYSFADDCDFLDLDIGSCADHCHVGWATRATSSRGRYGITSTAGTRQPQSRDESGAGLEDALSITVVIDQSLGARWSIHNDRIKPSQGPRLYVKKTPSDATNSLGASMPNDISAGA